ncbi:MAG TPA: hypothetical protein DCZ72_01270 [Armatimonadetes bacterium]|nr:hypothetical protein [Armatimonadota bacterium]
MMDRFEEGLARRLRTTSLLVGSVVFLSLLGFQASAPTLLSFCVGLGLALMLWWSAERVVTGAMDETLTRAARLGWLSWHVAKYALIFWGLGRMHASGWLEPFGFTGGFSIPAFTVMLKALGVQTLGDDGDPVPTYLRAPNSERRSK